MVFDADDTLGWMKPFLEMPKKNCASLLEALWDQEFKD